MKLNLNSTTIDLTTLEAYAAGNQDFIIEILNIYLQEMPIESENLFKEFEANNLKGVAFQAHKMKSNTQLCGVEPLTELLISLENGINNHVENLDIKNTLFEVKQSLEDSLQLIDGILKEMTLA